MKNNFLGFGILVAVFFLVTGLVSADSSLSVSLNGPLDNSSGPQNMSFNATVVGINETYGNCTLFMNETINQSIIAANNSVMSFNLSEIGVGSWFWNVSCWVNDTAFSSSSTWNYTVLTTTTTTTTTTSTTSPGYVQVYQPEDLFSMAIDFGAGFFGGLVVKAPLMGSSTGILIVISLITAVLLLMVFVIAKVISAIGKVTSEARKLGGDSY